MKDIQWSQLQKLMENPDCINIRPHALYVYSPTCGTCKMGETMLDIVHHTMPELRIYKLDLNTSPKAAEIYQIRSIPCLLIWRDSDLKATTPEIHYAMHSVTHLYSLLGGGCV